MAEVLAGTAGRIGPYSGMFPTLLQVSADTAVVLVARDGLGTASAWAGVALLVMMGVVLIVLTVLLIELRNLSKQLRNVADTVGDRSRPLIESMNGAAQNVEFISTVIRGDVEKVRGSLDGLADGLSTASTDLQRRLADFSALLDLAQQEAEDAVLDAATRVRKIRSGTKLLGRVRKYRKNTKSTSVREPAEPPKALPEEEAGAGSDG